MKAKSPTQKEKIAMYEQFLHDIQLCETTGRDDLLSILINNACSWSYAHRVGNGEHSEKEQDQLVTNKFWKLTSIPDILK